MVGFRVCVASRPPGKGKGRSLKLAALSGRSERARDWNEATLQEALIAPRSVDWPQLSSYPRLAPLCWASGSWSRVLLGGFQLSSNRGQYPIRCSSEDQLSGHDKMIKCQSLDQKPAHDVLDYWQIATAVLMLSPLVHWWAEKLSQAPKNDRGIFRLWAKEMRSFKNRCSICVSNHQNILW